MAQPDRAVDARPAVGETNPTEDKLAPPLKQSTSYAPWSRNPADTPEAVSIIGFGLGCLFVVGLKNALRLSDAFGEQDGERGLLAAMTSPQLGFYLAAMAVFHMSEYLTTAIYNPEKVKVGSYLLHNGIGYHLAHLTGVVEYILSETYLPASLRNLKHVPIVLLASMGMIALGQYGRSQAMITAAANFSHDVVFVKAEKHVLVTNGIYEYSRHPSYAAFFYWAIGTQVFLGNPISTAIFVYVLWRFFDHRIQYEEQALIEFFGNDYVEYRKRVGTLIPFCK